MGRSVKFVSPNMGLISKFKIFEPFPQNWSSLMQLTCCSLDKNYIDYNKYKLHIYLDKKKMLSFLQVRCCSCLDINFDNNNKYKLNIFD